MAFERKQDAKIDPTGKGRIWAGRVTLSSGSATIDYSADLPGVDASLDNEPWIQATAKGADDSPYVDSAGTSQATISGGGGTGSYDVNITIHEQGGD